MSTEDHPDWWRPVGGANSQESILERRSLVWNDSAVVAPAAPPASYTEVTWKGKFFTRGCRGMIEELQIYCVRTGAGTLRLAISPHPCLGPFAYEMITPGATWGWVSGFRETMWNYDSLFIWVYECSADVSWAYDAVQPHDGHWSTDAGATWADLAIRPFIRAVYTGETPGDVPVSGILDVIILPNESSSRVMESQAIPTPAETTLVNLDGAGWCDLIFAWVDAAANSQVTLIRVYCDGNAAFAERFNDLNTRGHVATTPVVSLLSYAADGLCVLQLSKRFEFRRNLTITFQNLVAVQTVSVKAHPTLMR